VTDVAPPLTTVNPATAPVELIPGGYGNLGFGG
jgi:hypothetical protein